MNETQLIDLSIDYKKTFETEHGKRVLSDIIGRSHVLSSTFAENPNEMAFNEGKRYLALMVWNFAEKDISELRDHLKIIKEQRNTL